jgi:hypothetical protein
MLGSGMFERILEFEQALAEYTGAPYAVMTDCCTHAIELCLRYRKVKRVQFTAFTYISVVMTMHKLNIDYELVPERWCGEYRFYGTDIWDSARRLEPGMYRQGQMQCLSFGFDKPLQVGRGGAILLDDQQAYQDFVSFALDCTTTLSGGLSLSTHSRRSSAGHESTATSKIFTTGAAIQRLSRL